MVVAVIRNSYLKSWAGYSCFSPPPPPPPLGVAVVRQLVFTNKTTDIFHNFPRHKSGRGPNAPISCRYSRETQKLGAIAVYTLAIYALGDELVLNSIQSVHVYVPRLSKQPTQATYASKKCPLPFSITHVGSNSFCRREPQIGSPIFETENKKARKQSKTIKRGGKN